jgi:hypothetical protein
MIDGRMEGSKAVDSGQNAHSIERLSDVMSQLALLTHMLP